MAYAQLRVDERARAYVCASGANVALTVTFTVALVVFADQGARGLLLGNFGASALVVLGLWWVLRAALLAAREARRTCARCCASACRRCRPTRACTRCRWSTACTCSAATRTPPPASTRSRCSWRRSCSWWCAAFSTPGRRWRTRSQSDREASRLYSLVTTYFVLATGVVVCAVALLGRWLVRLLAAPEYFGAHAALPWLALGWTLYGLYQVMIVITGRARVTARNLPAAAGGPGGERRAAAAARARRAARTWASPGRASRCAAPTSRCSRSCTCSRARCSRSAFEWRRLALLAVILGGVAVSGELLLPTGRRGVRGARCGWPGTGAAGADALLRPDELTQARLLLAGGRRLVAGLRTRGG